MEKKRTIGVRSVMVMNSSGRPEFKDDQETRLRSINARTRFIKSCGRELNTPVTDADIATKIGISPERFAAYLDGTQEIPKGFFQDLYDAYKPLTNAYQLKQQQQSLKNSIRWIRNCGLAKGMDITLEEMLEKIGLTRDMLLAYLEGHLQTEKEFGYLLEQAYQPLIEGIYSVTIKESIADILGAP